ncbi:aminotransferase class IV family protein [Pseudonocardia sp. Ae717_Ps2]|uniref:aminotransferase class IV family protein n=1 Tax=Pseudonocardia sp. Ae717_Ps2 TaxID=1885573 RepID=UPI00094ADFCF|nr:aminotransferase class IV family protein [Pseudonocardia sp. Ae717_Ps2]
MTELNGRPATAAELQALALTNYGHYTAMRVDDGAVRGLTHHLERLVRDCRTVFGVDLDRGMVHGYIAQAIEGRSGSFNVRVTVYDPALEMGHPGDSANPQVLVTTRPTVALPAPPLRAGVAPYTREFPEAKHIGLFGALAHRRSAQLRGFDDVLFCDDAKQLSEGATWNVGFYDGENVIWPDAAVLPGITMTLLQQVHDDTVIRPVTLDEVGTMQAAFATNVTVGVRALAAIETVDFPTEHPIIEVLRDEFAEIPPEPVARTVRS